MFFAVSALSFLCLLPSTEAGASFSKLAPIPTPRRSAAGGVVTNLNDGSPEVWVTGGSTSDGPINTVEVYSLSWGDWREEAAMSQDRAHHGATSLGGKLYVGGGVVSCGDKNCQTDSVEMYSPDTKSWSDITPLSRPRKGLAFASDEATGLLYAVGGMDCMDSCGGLPVEYLSTAEVYDPSTGDWSALPPMPTPRTDLSLAVIDSLLYAVGGCGGDGTVVDAKNCDPLTTMEVYDPSTKTWSSGSPLLHPRHGFALGVYGSQLIAAGGSSASGIDGASSAGNLTKTVDVLDTGSSSSWFPIITMPDPREGLVSGNLLVGISMLLISGEDADASLQATNEYMALMCYVEPPPYSAHINQNLQKILHGVAC